MNVGWFGVLQGLQVWVLGGLGFRMSGLGLRSLGFGFVF